MLRYAARPLPTLREALPGPRATVILAGLLGLHYVVAGVLVRPEGVPQTAGPHVVLAAIYVVLIAILLRLVRRDRRALPEHLRASPMLDHVQAGLADPTLQGTPPRPPHLDPALRIFLVGYPLLSAALSTVPPVAQLVVVVTWVVAIPYGAWQLGRAAYRRCHHHTRTATTSVLAKALAPTNTGPPGTAAWCAARERVRAAATQARPRGEPRAAARRGGIPAMTPDRPTR